MHAGWVLFAWAFLYVSIWPLIDVVLVEEWEFSDLLVMVVGGLLFFIAAAAISPDATYEDADGDSRYLEVAPVFFGFFAAYQAWLIVLDGTLVRSEELAPLQGAIVALWVAGVALAVLMAVALTMVQLINRHSGFRPYLTHTAWALWMFFWMILVWWRVPLLVTDGWNTTISCSSQPARSSFWGSYPSLARFLVWLLRHSPGNRLATAAPEDGEHGIVALTALGFNAQPVRAFDIDSGGAAREVLYLGGNADL